MLKNFRRSCARWGLCVGYPPTTAEVNGEGERCAFEHDEGSQTDVRLSFPGLGLRDPRYSAVQLLVRVLDDGLSARVHRRLCDEMGLAYEAFASVEAYEDGGVLDFGASVEHSKTPRLVEELMALTALLREEEVSEEELDRARRRYLWDLQAMVDDPMAMAGFYGATALLEVKDTVKSRTDAVRAVTPAHIREVAEEIFAPDGARLACVGMLDRKLQGAARDALEGS